MIDPSATRHSRVVARVLCDRKACYLFPISPRIDVNEVSGRIPHERPRDRGASRAKSRPFRSEKRTAGLSRHGSAGAGRQLRPDQIAPNQPQIVARYASASAVARARLGAPRRLAYGPGAVEGFIFTPRRCPTRRSSSSFTAAGGAKARRKTFPFLPRWRSAPARISSRSISTTW